LVLAKGPGELFVVEGKTHADLYDDYHVALPKLIGSFEESLTKEMLVE
jgi:hypothetical protein